MQSTFVLVADSATTTTDGKLALSGLFRKVFARNFPAVHTSMVIAFGFDDAPVGEFDANVRIVERDTGHVSLNHRMSVAANKEDDGNAIGVLNVSNVLFPNAGYYDIIVSVDDKDQIQTDIRVTLLGE